MSDSRLDLVLIHPGDRRRIYQSMGENLSAVETPVWALMIAAFIRNQGHSVAIVDAEAEELSPEMVAQRVIEMDPVLTAVVAYGHQPSASTQNMTVAGEICSALKLASPASKTILLGGHVASLPERTFREEDVDFVATGEGPLTVLDLLQALTASDANLKKVRGLMYWDDGKVVTTLSAPLLNHLDQEMPELAYDLLPMDKYRAHNRHCFGGVQRQPYAAMYTTLGCPYHCTFCCIQAPFKSGEESQGMKVSVNSYRFWSPETIVNQIDTLVNKYGIHNIRISDEMFVLNRRHVEGLCDLIIERGFDLNMWAYARVDTMKGEETTEKLKRAGVNWLCFGFESANEHVRDDVAKSYSQEEIYTTVDKVGAAGIYVLANYIFGLPEDNLQAMQETLDLSLELNCEWANFYCAMAYPGSQLYNQAVEKGWALPEKWTGYSQHSVDSLPLPTNYLTGPEVLRFRDEAWQTYFTNQRYLDMIGRKFDAATVAHIREMTSHQLVRNNA